MAELEGVAGSFRDPHGFLFRREDRLYRQIHPDYQRDYQWLMESGLYERLVNEGLLIAHEEADLDLAATDAAWKVIRPRQVPFISYPYEWCFSQLQDAALLTLRLQKEALEHGMSLKDASAYNVQFVSGKPVFIDTLSFERYEEDRPWVAYHQFCQHFLAPLALMAFRDARLHGLFKTFLDGIPLDLASRLLPIRTRLRLTLLTHLHLQASAERHFSERVATRHRESRVSRRGLLAILDSLESGIRGLTWQPAGTQWADYYSETNYSAEAWDRKRRWVGEVVERIGPETVWDLGANTGVFSRIAAATAELTLAFDADPAAVEKNYRECRESQQTGILPLILDLTNPSPSLGWANRERSSLLGRGRPDLVLALALIHHLAIANNLPLARIAEFFRELCSSLVIEFVPKEDSQVQRMLATRQDVFPEYSQATFEESFGKYFHIREAAPLPDSLRRVYLMTPAGS